MNGYTFDPWGGWGTQYTASGGQQPADAPWYIDLLELGIEAGERFELLDMRSPEERAVASIPGSTLLTPEVAKRLESLPKDAMFVFHSHRGDRGRRAAEHFAALGFTNVWNVEGGIDAWSQEIDPDVPRY